MRGAVLAKGGKSILALQSTAQEGTVSRIVPFLPEGAGATLNRGATSTTSSPNTELRTFTARTSASGRWI